MGASGCAGSQGRRKPRWLGPSRLSAAHLRKGGNWICLGGAPAPPAPTAGPRGPKARFALCGVWFSTAGEWAREGRAVHGGGARAIKGVPQAAAATRSFAVPGTLRPYYPASHGPRGPGRARVGMQPGKCRATWLFWESVRAREGLMWTPPNPHPLDLLGPVPCSGSPLSGSWRTSPQSGCIDRDTKAPRLASQFAWGESFASSWGCDIQGRNTPRPGIGPMDEFISAPSPRSWLRSDAVGNYRAPPPVTAAYSPPSHRTGC